MEGYTILCQNKNLHNYAENVRHQCSAKFGCPCYPVPRIYVNNFKLKIGAKEKKFLN
jgi:hypothetical protein